MITVHNRFQKFDGEGTVNADGTVSGHLVIDATSLTTKNRKRDEHLRSADFFDVEHHPTVTISLPTGSVPSVAESPLKRPAVGPTFSHPSMWSARAATLLSSTPR